MARIRLADVLIPSGLIAWCLIPVVAGLVRLAQLAAGGPVDPANARFFAAPCPVVLHIASVSLYGLLGALQFAPGIRRAWPTWHRAAGRVLIVAGLAAALSGLWMAMSYAIVPADSPLLHAFRLVFGTAMVLSLLSGTVALRQRDFIRHQEWMRRAYAIGLGAGTQALTQLPLVLLREAPDGLALALMMGAAWVMNVAVAEWLIGRARLAAVKEGAMRTPPASHRRQRPAPPWRP